MFPSHKKAKLSLLERIILMCFPKYFGVRIRALQNFRRLIVGSALLFGVFLAVSPAYAQFDTAAVTGTVLDPSGSAIPNAKVSLRNTDLGTVLTRKTDSRGSYDFPDVQVGTYTVTVDAPGFAESVTKPFDLIVSARQKIDVPLSLGVANETVTVTLDNAGLQTETGDQSTTVESEQMIDLPLNGREYTDLALLVPGVQVGALEDGSVDQRRGSIVVNGNRSSINNFLLDGLDNNSYEEANQGFNNQAVAESVDAVQEYTVITSNFPAEYGRAGGAIVNVKTKSGSDTLHWTLFEYLRNTAFDAYGPFYGTGQKPALVQNQFGGSVGYHVPHVKDFFFFIDYEGFRQATHTINSATLPTVQQTGGIFTAPTSTTNPAVIAVPLQNPLTSKLYNNGIIPQSDYTPFAAAVLAALPQPTITLAPGTTGTNFQYLGPGHNFRDIGDIRLDKYFGNRLQTFARLSKQEDHITVPPGITGPAGGGGFGHIRVITSSGAGGATYVATPSSVFDLRLGVTFANTGKKSYNSGVPNFYTPFNIPYPVPTSIANSGLNTQDVLDFSGFGTEDSNNEISSPQTYDGKISYTLAKGRHSFNFGYEWELVEEVTDPGYPLLGIDTYDGEFSYSAPSGVTRPASSVARRQAYGLADFIFGARDTYSLGNFNVPTEYNMYDYAYAEDSWKVSPRLTLTYGLRYEFATPERAHGQPIVNFDADTNGLQVGHSGSIYNQALVYPKLDDFAPRLGFAYSLYPNIVFRGGYGLSYIQFNRYGTESDLLANAPYTIDGQVTQAVSEPLCPSGSESLTCFRPTMQGYPTSLISSTSFSTTTTATYYVPRHSAPGYVQSYSLGTQVQIDKGTIFNLAYVGGHDVHVRVLADYNEAPVQLPGQTLSLQSRRPISNFTDIHDSVSAGFLRYNSLQAQLTHRTTGGLYLINSFTFSKAIDNASASLEESHGDSEFISLRNINYDNGISGYDQRWNDSLGAVWKIPFGGGIHNLALRETASGWTITSITRATAGVPENIYYAPDDTYLTSDIGNYRPDYTGYVYTIMNPRSQWVVGNGVSYTANGVTQTCTGYCNVFNTSQISNPNTDGSNTPYGNMPRNALTGPRYFDIDMGLQKNFTLPERVNLQLRAEAFNLLNHTNFKAPDTEFGSSTFGQYSPGSGSVFPSRQLQFAVRLSY
jgi:hypothetical protein